MGKRTPGTVAGEPASPREFLHVLVDAILADARHGTWGGGKPAFESGSKAVSVLRWVARQPDNLLGAELAGPAVALLRAIHQFVTQAGSVAAAARQANRTEWVEAAEAVLDQLHFALAVMARNLHPAVCSEARRSKNPDLLGEAAAWLIGDGHEAARLLEHFAAVVPEEFEPQVDEAEAEPSWIGRFAWDTYLRVAALDRLADRFPDLARPVARQMDAWPMLRHRHTDSTSRFALVAERLQLGTEHPLDASKSTKHRPDTPLAQYLNGLVCRLHELRLSLGRTGRQSVRDGRTIAACWCEPGEPVPGGPVLAILRTALGFAPLTKDNAQEWARQVLVPYIMEVEAKDAETCSEPAFQSVWNQQGKAGKVKSRAEFKSRLTPDVVKQLRSMARPAPTVKTPSGPEQTGGTAKQSKVRT